MARMETRRVSEEQNVGRALLPVHSLFVAKLAKSFGALVLPETLSRDKRRPFEWHRANPIGGFRQVTKLPVVAWFLFAAFLFEIANFVYPAVWAYFTKEAYGWSSVEVGFSLAMVGLGWVIVQGWLIRYVLKVFGDRPSPGMLSFPRPGVTLALDFPNQPNVFWLLDRLDNMTR